MNTLRLLNSVMILLEYLGMIGAGVWWLWTSDPYAFRLAVLLGVWVIADLLVTDNDVGSRN